MKLLLDTHIWLWSQREPQRIGPRLQQHLESQENQLWLSPVSTWEALTLHRKGRIKLHVDPTTWIERATAQLSEAPLTHEIVLVSHMLNLPQADPADRFLAATAKVLGLTLVSEDRNLLGLGEIATLANT
ncbi:MAG: type II toxin-antitoxin system VapC family toxin [Acidobacteriota bacterium]